MASNTFGQKTFSPVAPVKGSFPLDHEGTSSYSTLNLKAF